MILDYYLPLELFGKPPKRVPPSIAKPVISKKNRLEQRRKLRLMLFNQDIDHYEEKFFHDKWYVKMFVSGKWAVAEYSKDSFKRYKSFHS